MQLERLEVLANLVLQVHKDLLELQDGPDQEVVLVRWVKQAYLASQVLLATLDHLVVQEALVLRVDEVVLAWLVPRDLPVVLDRLVNLALPDKRDLLDGLACLVLMAWQAQLEQRVSKE